MGRAKLEIKYREASQQRINTYKTRIKGIEKKAEELSILCGVDVLFASFSPDLNTLHCWPKIPSEFHRILHRYKSISSNPQCDIPSPPLNSIFLQEHLAINIKLQEVRQRICFLEAEKMAADPSHEQICEDIDCCPHVSVVNEDKKDDIYSMLEDIGEDLALKEDWTVAACYNENYFDSEVISTIFAASSHEKVCEESSMEGNDYCSSVTVVNKEEEDIYSMLEDLGEDLTLEDDWTVGSGENYFDSAEPMCADLEGISAVFAYC